MGRRKKLKKGRPLRSAKPAKIRTMRITDEDYELLKSQFGSLGNAAHFAAQGIRDYLEKRSNLSYLDKKEKDKYERTKPNRSRSWA